MGQPSLKIPAGPVVWKEPTRSVFLTREADGRYYVWVRSPEMVRYGYRTGYAWTFNLGNKKDAVRRARRELAHLATRYTRRDPAPTSRGRRTPSSRKGGVPTGVAKALHYLRTQLRELGVEHGYLVKNTIGPYDHNAYDYALPTADFPKVFRANYEAVEYAEEWLRRYLPDAKLAVCRVDGTVHPGTYSLRSQVVWRSWKR